MADALADLASLWCHLRIKAASRWKSASSARCTYRKMAPHFAAIGNSVVCKTCLPLTLASLLAPSFTGTAPRPTISPDKMLQPNAHSVKVWALHVKEPTFPARFAAPRFIVVTLHKRSCPLLTQLESRAIISYVQSLRCQMLQEVVDFGLIGRRENGRFGCTPQQSFDPSW